MNKLLTTIILLCFSVAANADIWFCETNYMAVVGYDNGLQRVQASGQTFTIDTDKGVRLPPFGQGLDLPDGFESPEMSYRGSCEKMGIHIICSDEYSDNQELVTVRGLATFSINTENLKFTYSANIYSEWVTSATGTCIKA